MCSHKHAIMLECRRVTRVPNRLRGRMYIMRCHCGAQIPIAWPLGSKAKRPPADEMRIARMIPTLTNAGWTLKQIDALTAEFAAPRVVLKRENLASIRRYAYRGGKWRPSPQPSR